MIKKAAAITLCIMISLLALAACVRNGAESAVKEELAGLRSSQTAASSLASVQENLPKEAGEDFEAFLAKVRDFDYVILGSEKVTGEDGTYTSVNVKITSYDFGKEYLATWKDYLKTHKNASAEDAEGAEFYKELFARLAKLGKKDHISFVEIRAYESADGGWTTDIKTNEELQDALFGGMISEMKTLAAE